MPATIETFERLGFDRCTEGERECDCADECDGCDDCLASPKSITIRCSQCEAAVICGVPCHENGCPNRNYPCRECDINRVGRDGALCETCTNFNYSLEEPDDDEA